MTTIQEAPIFAYIMVQVKAGKLGPKEVRNWTGKIQLGVKKVLKRKASNNPFPLVRAFRGI